MFGRFFGYSEKTAAQLSEQALSFADKYRVEVRVPFSPPDAMWTIRSDHPAEGEVLDTAQSGERLRVLVCAGEHRIIATCNSKMASRAPRGVLLFSGNVQADVSLHASQDSARVQ